MNAAPEVVLYSRRGCAPCDRARDALRRLRREVAFELRVVDVDADPALAARHGEAVPVVAVGGAEVGAGGFDRAAVQRAIMGAALDV